MLAEETQTPDYFLFDHSYAGGSWNMAVIEQAAALRKRAEAAEAQCDRLKRENDALRDVKDRLLPANDALFALRRHIFECDDCADGEHCESADELWRTAIRACDEVYGKPGDWE